VIALIDTRNLVPLPLLSGQNPRGIPVAGFGESVPGGAAMRFDALLAEVSKTLAVKPDTSAEGPSSKLRAAIAAAVATLVQGSVSQVQQLAVDGHAKQNLVEGLSNAYQLDPREKAMLGSMVEIAVNQVSERLSGAQVYPPGLDLTQDASVPEPRGSSEPADKAGETSGMPGPKGRTPEKQGSVKAVASDRAEPFGVSSGNGGSVTTPVQPGQERLVSIAGKASAVSGQSVDETGLEILVRGAAPKLVSTSSSATGSEIFPTGGPVSAGARVKPASVLATYLQAGTSASQAQVSVRTVGLDSTDGEAPSVFAGRSLKREIPNPAEKSKTENPETSSRSAQAALAASLVPAGAVSASVADPVDQSPLVQTVEGVDAAQDVRGISVAGAEKPMAKASAGSSSASSTGASQVEDQTTAGKPSAPQTQPASDGRSSSPKAPALEETIASIVFGAESDALSAGSVPSGQDLPEWAVVENAPSPQAKAGSEKVLAVPANPGESAADPQALPSSAVSSPAIVPAGERPSIPAVPSAVLAAEAPGLGRNVPVQAPSATAPVSVTSGRGGSRSVQEASGKQAGDPAPLSEKSSGEGREFRVESLPVSSLQNDVRKLADGVIKEFTLRESILKQVAAQIEGASRETSLLHIKLKPESLGSLDVTLATEGGKLAAKIFAATAEVRDVIYHNLAQFKQALENQGIPVQELSVAVRADVHQGFGREGQQSAPWQSMLRRQGGSVPGQSRAADWTPADWVSTSSQLSVLA
jgi:flagellar hook-length control protein FliK